MKINGGTFEGKQFWTIGTVQILESELWELLDKKYIVTYGGVYQICYTAASKAFYGLKVSSVKNLASRGRFYKMTGSEVNQALGYKLLNDF